MDWARDGRDWPHREASRFVEAGGLRWHVQQMGAGPSLLLIHGTGASTHSWRGLAPLLAASHTVIAADLPGHGFTTMPRAAEQTLPGMARALTALLRALGVGSAEGDIDAVVGHSAGAAIALRMVFDGAIRPRRIVSLNGALLPLDGLPGLLFPPIAKMMAAVPLLPRVFAWRAQDRQAVRRLIEGTGSMLDAEGVELYGRLVRDAGHAAAALAMMANWDLVPLARELPRLRTPLQLVVGAQDRAVPPWQADSVLARLAPGVGRRTVLQGLGHLAHEEAPGPVAKCIGR